MAKTKELEAALAKSLEETKKAGPKPPYVSWENHPAGWMKHRSWVRAENRRRAERRKIRQILNVGKAK